MSKVETKKKEKFSCIRCHSVSFSECIKHDNNNRSFNILECKICGTKYIKEIEKISMILDRYLR